MLDRFKLPGHPHLHHVQRGLHRAGRFDCVLLAQLVEHLVEIQTQLRQTFLRNLDEEFFVLRAKLLHLGDIRHTQQLLPRVIGKGLELGVAETVGLQRVDHAIHIAKIVVEKWANHATRQAAAHVAHLFAHRVPDTRHISGFGRVFDLEDDL